MAGNHPASEARDSGLPEGGQRKCFVISAFGQTPEEKRAYKQVLKHMVKKILEPRYDVKRADELAAEGLITNQIIERLLDDDLVVADLTGLNPNVFYEMAVRHAARKPIVHLISVGVEIPFDVANMRTIQYSLSDPDQLEQAQHELEGKVSAIEDADFKAASNPITAARDVAILRQSEQPEVQETAAVLHALNELRDEFRQLGRRVEKGRAPESRFSRRMVEQTESIIRDRVIANVEPMSLEQIADELGGPPRALLLVALNNLRGREDLYRLPDGRWSDIPF